MQKILNHQRLQTFHQVVLSGSIRSAAELLGVDPSSISRAIGQLEKELGMTLLERHGRGVQPTEAGHMLMRYLYKQETILSEFQQELRQVEQASRGQINICMGEGMVDMIFAPVVTPFLYQNPDITLNLSVNSQANSVEHILNDNMDMALIYGIFDDARLRVHARFPASPIHAIVHETHPLNKLQRPLTLADLSAYPGAMLDRSFGLSHYIRAAESNEQTQLQIHYQTSSYRALWHLVNARLCYTLCGTSFAHWFNLPELRDLPMRNPIFNQCELYLVTRAGRYLSPAAKKMLQYLSEHLT